MCCRCHVQPGTGGRSNQSPWTSGVKGGAATRSRAGERHKGKKTGRGGGGEDGRGQIVEERRRTAETAIGEEPGHGQRRRLDGKCPGHVRNADSGTGGAPRRFQSCFRRSVAQPGVSIDSFRGKQRGDWEKERKEHKGSGKDIKGGKVGENK
ncbi:hypothetical protein NDU88_001287 [Pleurodeles waltl]|uniref:Uncharacterized protein n=1 Tax=Pleurodeles waltl TaxID=8319 RepID=A0AAV7V9C7_PLEWA|nr:hypothetical protein NDU88_001287 [Pleurodeles waltl]